MSVLGKSKLAYDSYASLIRKEYRHVPHDVYCERRAEILESFLVSHDPNIPSSGDLSARRTIFATQCMMAALEWRARENLRREIDSLRNRVIPHSG